MLTVETTVQLHKRLEQSLQILSVNSNTIINDRELYQVLFPIGLNLQNHLAILKCEFDSIAQQVYQDLFESPRVSKYFGNGDVLNIGDCDGFLCGLGFDKRQG